MAATIGPNGYTHTRALLAYLFTTYSKNRRVDATSPLLLGVKGLALHGLASSSTSTESGDDDAEDVEGEGHESTAPTSAASSASDVASDEDR
jgi:secreted protein with Ig-like and vWFA domain